MKKLFFLSLLALATACTQRPKPAQDVPQQQDSITVITVQGHPHDVLTRLHAEGKWQHPQHTFGGSTDNINFADIKIWAGSPTSTNIDSAALVIKWTDKKQADSILIWGYRWDHNKTQTSVDMLRAVAAKDKHFLVLLQDAGVSPASGDTLNYAIGGMGYNPASSSRPQLDFNLAGAQADTAHIKFHYNGSPNTSMEQISVPSDAQAQAKAAIQQGRSKGYIEHPFNYQVYHYPAYDYDYWTLPAKDLVSSWQSGWYNNGYWSFWVKSQPAEAFSYSPVGASQRVLQNRYVDGWAFAVSFSNVDMGGNYTPAK